MSAGTKLTQLGAVGAEVDAWVTEITKRMGTNYNPETCSTIDSEFIMRGCNAAFKLEKCGEELVLYSRVIQGFGIQMTFDDWSRQTAQAKADNKQPPLKWTVYVNSVCRVSQRTANKYRRIFQLVRDFNALLVVGESRDLLLKYVSDSLCVSLCVSDARICRYEKPLRKYLNDPDHANENMMFKEDLSGFRIPQYNAVIDAPSTQKKVLNRVDGEYAAVPMPSLSSGDDEEEDGCPNPQCSCVVCQCGADCTCGAGSATAL